MVTEDGFRREHNDYHWYWHDDLIRTGQRPEGCLCRCAFCTWYRINHASLKLHFRESAASTQNVVYQSKFEQMIQKHKGLTS